MPCARDARLRSSLSARKFDQNLATGRFGPISFSLWKTKARVCRPFGDGASRTRTGDLLGAIQALSQLSYSPAPRSLATGSAGYAGAAGAPRFSFSLPARIVSAMSFDSAR